MMKRVTPELAAVIARSADCTDLDEALRPIQAMIDPENTEDLGGWASMFFSGEKSYEAFAKASGQIRLHILADYTRNQLAALRRVV